jgi:glutaredoxin-like protein NrdH
MVNQPAEKMYGTIFDTKFQCMVWKHSMYKQGTSTLLNGYNLFKKACVGLTAYKKKGSTPMTDKTIQLYSLTTCGHCKLTKKLLKECQAEFTFTDVDSLSKEERKIEIEKVKKLNPRCSFPTLVIGDKVIVGYRENEIREELDK